MNTNIFAYTESHYIPSAPYPGYVSLNKRHDGTVWLTVRTRGANDCSEVELTPDMLKKLIADTQAFVDTVA